MKRFLLYGAFVLALSACKNDKAKTDDKSTPSTTGTSGTSTPSSTTPSTDDDNTSSGSTSGGWSSAEKNMFIKTCTDAAARTMGQSKAASYCTCMEEKVEKMHPNAAEAGSMTQDDMTELAKECLK
jgi:hypothetical protein